ncbi:Synaptotagmin-1 [Glycine soja]|uniref:Synaptotagmin-1 n=1 Tax=Glycine soja TaxID=3848 RepID=A0A0B2REN4_GLYSO|nr:Synaptotagmin-1 [Glycine soja]
MEETYSGITTNINNELHSKPKPRIDYTLKAIGGSLTAIPGISDMIDDTVNSIVTHMLQWPHRIVVQLGGIPIDTSELELKSQGKLALTVVKAAALKNMEMIGKSDPYVVVHIRPLFKYKTKVIDNNLNPIWNEKFELIAEDKETQLLILSSNQGFHPPLHTIIVVLDKDIGQDKRLGIAQLPLIGLEIQTEKEIELRLLPSLDTLKLVALEAEKKILEERKKLKEAGVIGCTMDVLDGAVSVVGSGVGLVW